MKKNKIIMIVRIELTKIDYDSIVISYLTISFFFYYSQFKAPFLNSYINPRPKINKKINIE